MTQKTCMFWPQSTFLCLLLTVPYLSSSCIPCTACSRTSELLVVPLVSILYPFRAFEQVSPPSARKHCLLSGPLFLDSTFLSIFNLDITCLEKASLSHQIWASLPFSVLLYHSLSFYTTYRTAGDYLFTSPVSKLPKDNDCVYFIQYYISIVYHSSRHKVSI